MDLQNNFSRAWLLTVGLTIVELVSSSDPIIAQGMPLPPPRTYSPPPAYGSPAYTSQSGGLVRRGVPRTAPSSNTVPFDNPNSPAATGGGSFGYNQNLWNW
jgi:hypothetical protein